MTLTSLSAQKPPKPINLLGKSVQYVGVSTDKIPSGEGVLTIKNSDDSGEYIYTLSGEFSSTDVTNATFKMERQGVVFKGNVGYAVDKKLKNVVLTLTNGEFAIEDKSLISLVNDEQLVVSIPAKGAEISGVSQKYVEYDFKAKDIELAKRFAGDDKYTNIGGAVCLTASTAEGLVVEGLDRITGGTMTFSNGATVSIDKGSSEWKRANGDLIVVNYGKISRFTIAIAEGVISHNKIDYKFANGAKYVGSYKNFAPQTLEALIDLKSINWEFNDDVDDNIVSGKLTYAANKGYISFKDSQVVDFNVYVGDNCRVSNDKVDYIFPNGIMYRGGYNDCFMTLLSPMLLNPENFVWEVEKFNDYITRGTLYFSTNNTTTAMMTVEKDKKCNIGNLNITHGCATYNAADDVYTYNGTDGTKVQVKLINTNLDNQELIRFDNLITRQNIISLLNRGGYGELIMPNGEYFRRDQYGRLECHVIYDKGTLDLKDDICTITHTFENGNKYVGTMSVIPDIINFTGEDWKWADFNKYVFEGELTLANGTRKRYMEGYEESVYREMIKKWEVEKKNDFSRYDSWSGTYLKYKVTFKDLSYIYYDREGDYISFRYKNGDQVDFRNINDAEAKDIYYKLTPEKYMLPSIDSDFDAFFKKNYIDMSGVCNRFYKDGLRIIQNDKRVYQPIAKGGVWYDSKLVYDYDLRAEVVGSYYIRSLDYVKDGNTYTQKYIKLKNGQHFEGSYRVILDESKTNPLNEDKRLKMRNITLCPGPDAIIGVEFFDGALFDAKGNVIEVYSNGDKLSASETIPLESQYKAQRARREKVDNFVAKGYKQDHVESVIDGYIPIGAPIKLLIEYHGSAKVKADGWYDDAHEYRNYTGLGRFIAVDSKGKIVEHIRAY